MSPAPSKSLSSEQLVSILEADPSFTAGLGKGKGPVQTGLTSAKPQKPFSSPAQGVWPGLVAAILMAIALGLCIHTAWQALADHRAAQRAHAQELEIIRRTGEDEKLRGSGSGGSNSPRDLRELRDAPPRDWKPDGDVDALRRLNGSGSVGVLSAPSATSPPVTIDHTRRYHGAV
ncbi:hypothetical protein A1Q1_03317 [Trichosporon asahii var. asahii CBS 2479]|uniref:Uncharacterized protein n=1 Tax=Trichosporon asahii var. asahii (strain ATCC 90039 / CBS 2479 / JCM 2466 / KCTC 7840 / NBRC 103889/ NCYC 2677 / UAMH 7654) TaxID=1186058 RepID=J6EY22_TRIAS|nr:hypothetical protein A1Q1_03317 [Trichosporon asahii var. asahii CBS 2479]EJT47742.1 hypothetical protein A1Q1_03317 [Trichosporon asahii var. asahii CBS 2479]